MIDTYYYFKEKFINDNADTDFLINFLLDEDYIEKNRKELHFKIKSLSLVQFLKVFEAVIFNIDCNKWDIPDNKMPLSEENLKLFIFFENRFDENELAHFKLNYNLTWWGKILDFSGEFDLDSNEKSIKKFETEYNRTLS